MQPSQEALQRLAGADSKRRKVEEEGFNQIIDVNFDDIKPDEREWLTKALTEDDADAPGPKVNLFCQFKTLNRNCGEMYKNRSQNLIYSCLPI